MMTLLMGTSTTFQTQDVCKDTYILSDTDCANVEVATISPQYFNEKNNLISTKQISHTTTRMGFSFSGIWDFLVARFATWFAEEEKEAEAEVETQAKTQTANQTKSIMFDCPAGTAPTFTAYALSASCANEAPLDDAYLQISSATDATHYDFTMGSTYTGTGFAGATAFDPLTDLPLQLGGLIANPVADTDYTIRVFNGSDACFTDVIVILAMQDCVLGCQCTEYLYINEPATNRVHKYEISGGDTTLVNGSTFLEGIASPHGLGVDINGNIYIGETSSSTGNTWKVTCDGTVLDQNFIPASGHNTVTVGNTLYIAGGSYANGALVTEAIRAYDLCTGNPVGTIDFCTPVANGRFWGFTYDKASDLFFATERQGDGGVYIFSPDNLNGDCISEAFTAANLETNTLGGITVDTDGFLYIASLRFSRIEKYDQLGNLIAVSAEDNLEDGTGWNDSLGIIYSETCDCIMTSNETDVDDCISIFDKDLNYIGAGIGASPGGENNSTKAIGILKECCPINNRQVINQTVCAPSSNVIFLNDSYDCEGVICEGVWEEVSSDANVAYEACNQSVTVTGLGGCATFVKSSDGTGNNLQCGAFEITLNICFYQQTEATAFALSPSCTDGIPNDDGYLQISAANSVSTHYDFTPGNTYTGAGMAGATAFDPATDLPLQFGTLANPSGSQDYTIRIFNGGDACFTDLIVTLNEQDCVESCNCTEFIYLNETTNDGAVHKFEINENFTAGVDPATAAIAQEVGSPWFDNVAAGETLVDPHGLGIDLNGYLYIGEGNRADRDFNVRRFTCDGEIVPSATFAIPDAGYNFASNQNILYIGTQDFDSATPNYINAYDLCTGDLIGFYCLTGIAESKDWGLYLDNNGMIYLTSNTFRDDQALDIPNQLYKFDVNTNSLNAPGEANPVCIDPFISEGAGEPASGDNTLPVAQLFGVTTDSDDNIFIVERTGPTEANGSPSTPAGTARILKYDSNGNFITATPWDALEDGSGYFKAIGIYYSETLDLLFVSTASQLDDCVVLFDTDLNNLGGAVPSPGDGSQSKGINIVNECCPTNNRQEINQAFCATDTSQAIFLNDVFPCPEGIICEGVWVAESMDPSISYESCNQSITINDIGCATFTKTSTGVGNNLQCGAFELTYNLCVYLEPEVTAHAIAASCTNGTPNDDAYLQITDATNATHYDYSIGSTYTGGGLASATPFNPATDLPLRILDNIPNPAADTDYTIRVFNQSDDGCAVKDIVVTVQAQDCAVGCGCTETIYLNETSDGGKVHKFTISPDGTLTEVFNNGNAWYPGAGTSELPSPHGLGIDLNGYLYIGETENGDIRRLTCDGTIVPTSEFVINERTFNIGSYGSRLFTNRRGHLREYNSCEPDTEVCRHYFDGMNDLRNWGLFVKDDTLYASATHGGAGSQGVWKIAIDDLECNNNANPHPRFIMQGTDANLQIGDNYLPNTNLFGITVDNAGNIYLIERAGNNASARILKYNSSGILVALTDYDTVDDGTMNPDGTTADDKGWHLAIGLVYSETCDCIYVSTTSPDDDCVSRFDTDLNYLGATVPTTGSAATAKGIAIIEECCPTISNMTIDTTLCGASIGDSIFLQQLIDCDGIICEGLWQEGVGNTGLIYNDCNNSIMIDASGCGTFTKGFNGAGGQCGPFEITVNICFYPEPEITAYALAASCTNGIPNDDAYLQISAAVGTHYDFTLGSTYTGGGFAGATAFDPATDLPLQFGGPIANPAAATDYTIRVFSGSDACFTDVVVTLEPQTDCAAGCECTEHVYLTEPFTAASVHKFRINADNSFTEIGSPWYDNDAVGETLFAPHGVTMDKNGYLYISEGYWPGKIRKLNCDGDVTPEAEFSIDVAKDIFGIDIIDNTIYYNNDLNDTGDILANDLCTTDLTGGVNFCESAGRDWGFHANPATGEMYATSGFSNDNYFWYFNTSDFDSDPNTCVSATTLTNFPTTNADIRGLTTDADNNVYIAVRSDNNIAPVGSYILKYGPAPTFTYIGMSAIDAVEDGTGYNQIIDLVYSETTNLIYSSNSSAIDDCVSTFDTDLNYLGAAVLPTGTGAVGKAIGIIKECCPTNNNQVIDQIYCISDTSALTFLNEVYECEGIICEGQWEVVSIDPTVTYDDCSQAVTLNGAGGCATFAKSSDGIGNNLQCGAFEITLNICFIIEPDVPVIAVTDNDCLASTPGAFTVSTACATGSTIEWSTDNGTTWSTTAPTYNTANPQTIIARCVDNIDATCLSPESTAVTSSPNDCCPTPNCFGISIQQN